MSRGFATGTLALIVLYVVVQPGTAGKADTASGWLQQGMRRWLASDVAGVPDRSKKKTTAPSATTAPSTGYYTV
jgi:hypothetical protein